MHQTAKPRFSRTRAGCLTCRSRKKKCDEVKPRCAGCRRNQLACEWPSGVSSDKEATVVARKLTKIEDADSQALVTISAPVSISNIGSERACGLTPQSGTLLSHYFRETASFFAMTPLKDNPFVTVLLPIGYTDDLLMHGLMALSGSHLTYKEPNNTALATATQLHYSKLLSGLRAEFSNLRDDDWEAAERLLRVLVVVCHYEALSGDTQGAIFNHLRASRHLIQSLLRSKSTKHAVNSDTLGFSLELYAHLVTCNTITPHGISSGRDLPLDNFIMTPEEMKLFPTFGSIFAGGHGLFQLVPEVSLLASERLAEEASGVPRASALLLRTHDELLDRITCWKMPPPSSPKETTEDWEHRRRAAEALRQGLYIYLSTALCGSLVSDPVVICAIQDHITKLFGFAAQLVASQYVATMLWPFVIAGSCMARPVERQALLRHMRSGWFSMRHLGIIGDTLELLWNDPDPRAYGPYGLHLIMEKHGISLGIA
ncbi:hypothetical protein BU24DRAFT_419629 [Aaosphaeria arxii CBS 175.79]|uniref:Zn(2)-C6 fungal-type domain-containing protein n=1 Tax=Aaosphaeria arxii CBS 175.79 TaxID=1450172 RepID=A0A6A5Y3J1_9PLEO|nr:uncharacterized protein BU24DRAFT_419629 [Aaosphaeria arxii CBS 175.79]KAF2020038.1 hypothetical protein BU24DRAFT_419629 [Aaosphaeria arxii CBS 175.79]